MSKKKSSSISSGLIIGDPSLPFNEVWVVNNRVEFYVSKSRIDELRGLCYWYDGSVFFDGIRVHCEVHDLINWLIKRK